jgi:YD repeat-containing protein
VERRRVDSPGLRAVAYDAARRLLEIEFPDGSVYQYERVPPELHRRLLDATSKRSFFEDHIEEAYSRRRV